MDQDQADWDQVRSSYFPTRPSPVSSRWAGEMLTFTPSSSPTQVTGPKNSP